MTEKKQTFEEAYARLEQILEKMNSASVSLDDSIKLYEEADKLVQYCQGRLMDAEQKIEILIKNRDSSLTKGNDAQVVTQDFIFSK